MKHLLIAFAVWAGLTVTQNARADEWGTTDKALATAAVVLTVADWAQTRTIAQSPDRYYETNPILGQHPTVGSVNAYFAGALIGGAVLAYTLPATPRRWFLGGAAALELAVVGRNAHLGIRMSF